jgi:hypothetical protein
MNWAWAVSCVFLFLWILAIRRNARLIQELIRARKAQPPQIEADTLWRAMRLIYRRDKRHLYLDDEWWNALMVLAHQHSYYVSGPGRDILISLAKERQRLKT